MAVVAIQKGRSGQLAAAQRTGAKRSQTPGHVLGERAQGAFFGGKGGGSGGNAFPGGGQIADQPGQGGHNARLGRLGQGGLDRLAATESGDGRAALG